MDTKASYGRLLVIPTKAGIHTMWIPAFAGMTRLRGDDGAYLATTITW
jgi:hypothetical protein